MEQAIITRGHFKNPHHIILDEDIKEIFDSVEIIIRPLNKTSLPNRKAGTLKNLIHINKNFNEPLEDFKEYTD